MFAEGLKVHKKIHRVPPCFCNPLPELLGGQRPSLPCSGRKTERDIVRETVVLEKEPRVRRTLRAIDEVRAPPPEHWPPPLGDNASVALRICPRAKVVAVGELGVAKDSGQNTEEAFYHLAMLGNLPLKFWERIEEGERMIIRFAKNLDATSRDQLPEEVKHAGRVSFYLREDDTREGEGDPEFRMSLKQCEQKRCGREVRFLGNLAYQAAVIEITFAIIIEVFAVMPYIKQSIPFQTIGLVYLEVEADRGHIRWRRAQEPRARP